MTMTKANVDKVRLGVPDGVMTVVRFITLFVIVLSARPVAADDILKIGMLALPESRGLPHAAIGPPYFVIWPALFDGLTQIDSTGKLQPALATAWTFTSPTTWRFTLRPAVTFANGEPCDAAAVVATFKDLLKPEALRMSVNNAFRGVVSARAVDPLTVEVVTDTPDRLLPFRIGAVRILPPAYYAKVGEQGFADQPIGTGPFVVQTWKPGRVVAKANPASWRAPHVAGLEIRAIPETNTRIAALLSGAIDIALNLGADDKDAITDAGGAFYKRPRGSVEVLDFITVKTSPLQDKRVRQALNYAVDKDAIVRSLMGGMTVVASQTAPRGIFGHDPTLKPYAYDPVKARALLTEAGYPKGFAMVTEVVTGTNSNGAAIYQKVADDLAAVGVRMELRPVPQAKMSRAAFEGTFEGVAFSINYGSLPYMDALPALRLHSCLWSKPWICNPAIAAKITTALGTFDLDERERLTKALVGEVRDDAPALLLYEDVVFDGIAARVKNYQAAFATINFETLALGK